MPKTDKTIELTEGEKNLRELVTITCRERARLYAALRPMPDDDDATRAAKGEYLIQKVLEWKDDSVAFIKDLGWVDDPFDSFGASAVPQELVQAGLLPGGMVPLIPYKAQTAYIRSLDEALVRPYQSESAMEKSRQVALTTYTLWWGLRVWLFVDQGHGAMGTYNKDLIDIGGKGNRSPDTLFGRMRRYLDAMAICVPNLSFKFEPDKKDQAFPSMLPRANDVHLKLTRPRWDITGTGWDPAPGAVGNFIRGWMPGDSFARGVTLKWAFCDEFAHYDSEIAQGTAEQTWSASAASVKVRIAGGTIPRKGGGQQSMLYKLTNVHTEGVDVQSVHWSDIAAYMAQATWRCRNCDFVNEHPIHPGPGKTGARRECLSCAHEQLVSRRDLTSPWYRRKRASYRGDKLGIACELDMDWQASGGETLFGDLRSDLVGVYHNEGTHLTFGGFDPGWTQDNAGCFTVYRLALERNAITPWLVGYWMSRNPNASYWVPMMKGWTSQATRRNKILYGAFEGKSFYEAYDYPDEFMEQLDRLAIYNMATGHIQGDKYGSHKHGTESAYQVMSRFGVSVAYEYTVDRQELVLAGVEWSTRLRVAEECAHIRPPKILGGYYPSPLEWLQGAKPKPISGQGEYKLDVDKKDPPHCSDAVDSYLYAVKGWAQEIHAAAVPEGGYEVEYGDDEGYVDWGDGLGDMDL